jgi:hypothetical protein
MVPLSAATRLRLVALFGPPDLDVAASLLETACGDNLLLLGGIATPESLERIRFAALKASNGNMDRLREAIQLAQLDWRDLLVGAGFCDELESHLAWLLESHRQR